MDPRSTVPVAGSTREHTPSTDLRVDVIGRGTLARQLAARLSREAFTVRARDDGGPLPDTHLLVWAREDCTVADALAANALCVHGGVSMVGAITRDDTVVLGPWTVPGRTGCLACALTSSLTSGTDTLDTMGALPVGVTTHAMAAMVAERVRRALSQTLQPSTEPTSLFREQHTCRPDGHARVHPVWPRGDCTVCASVTPGDTPFDLSAGRVLGRAPSVQGGVSMEDPRPVRRVGILGGGTAGYLTALALRQQHPTLEVTLLESSRIPVIGVGEATTPDVVDFLLKTLAVDERELYRTVRPTWKLGLRFLWGQPDGVFHHPFTGAHLLEACTVAHDQDLQSLGAQLMAHDRAPVLQYPDGRVVPLLDTVPYAYNLDNRTFVRFLQSLAARRGVTHVDCTVTEVHRAPDGGISRVCTDTGDTYSFDLYIDATGFRSVLTEHALGVPFQSYGDSLFTDAAVVAPVPHRGPWPLATIAETMSAGWCWNITLPDENHRGYVFSTAFLSPEAAEAEMRAKNPGMGPSRLVRFRAGRLSDFWSHNAVALGNAYGFVEPLESTALHLLVHQIMVVCQSLAAPGGATPALRPRINAMVGAHWDHLRDFLALHYKFNHRVDSPFWEACRRTVDLAGGADLLAAFREGAPLTARPDRMLLEDSLLRDGFLGLLGVDNILLGQRVPTRMLTPRGDTRPFTRWVETLPTVRAHALPHREALDAYRTWLDGVR